MGRRLAAVKRAGAMADISKKRSVCAKFLTSSYGMLCKVTIKCACKGGKWMRRPVRTMLQVLLTLLAFAFCALPKDALAADPAVLPVEVTGGSLADAIAANPTAGVFNVTGSAVSGCNIAGGITVNVSGGMDFNGCTNAGVLNVTGAVGGDFYNTGTVSGANKCGGTIYKMAGTVTGGGTVRIPGPAMSNVTQVRYADGSSESAKYLGGTLWTLDGRSVQYLVINDYVCTPDGARLAYSITYKYNNVSQSAMTLDTKKYPTTYYVKATGQDLVPEAPDTEVDYLFAGWYCKALGYDENNLQKTVSIDADKGGNLTLISWWTEAPGHNEGKANATTGMTAGGGTARSATSAGGAIGTLTGLLATEASEEEAEEAEEAVVDFASGSTSGVRIRTANNVQRHSFTDARSNEDIQAMAASKSASKRFPWQWVGAGLGAALTLLAVVLAFRRRFLDRDQATLEKLNIRD